MKSENELLIAIALVCPGHVTLPYDLTSLLTPKGCSQIIGHSNVLKTFSSGFKL